MNKQLSTRTCVYFTDTERMTRKCFNKPGWVCLGSSSGEQAGEKLERRSWWFGKARSLKFEYAQDILL